MMRIHRLLLLLALVLISTPVHALNNGSDGTDGVLNITTNTTIDLSLAPSAAWDTPSDPATKRGVYDSAKWAVVFKYDSVYVANGMNVTFLNHPSMAPVVWLVNRGVKIQGQIILDGSGGVGGNASFAAGGPGGFRGGIGAYWNGTGSPGFGPGGGQYIPGSHGGGGSYKNVGGNGGPAYGNDRVLPLIGGSGGAGAGVGTSGGGGGGGAILIASNRTLQVIRNGNYGGIWTRGGAGSSTSHWGGGGSAGAIRLIADTMAGQADWLMATGGNGVGVGSEGRIRLEANNLTIQNASTPPYTSQTPVSENGDIWPLDLPAVRVTYIGGQPAPSDPRANFNGPGDVLVITPNAVEVVMEANNVLVDGTWTVRLRLAPTVGDESTPPLTATMDPGGTTALSIWRVTLPALTVQRCSAIQARAHKLP